MQDTELSTTALDARVERRAERRDFFRSFGTALAMGGGMLLAHRASAQSSGPSEVDVLNFALNLEYLEAEFYLYATTGSGLPAALRSGNTTQGAQGAVIPGRQVDFSSDPLVGQYAREIAADELAHVTFLRNALMGSAVAEPAIDVGFGPGNAFTAVARAANARGAGIVLNGSGGTAFDPYASVEAFLLAAFIFEDVGVTAYKGGSPLINTPAFLEAAAGILAVEAYHAAIVRTTLYAKGIATPSLIQNVEGISDTRDALDSSASDVDQGIRPTGTAPNLVSNIVPTDADGVTFSRSPGDVLNIVYANPGAVGSGGFFPAGTNGALKTSTAA